MNEVVANPTAHRRGVIAETAREFFTAPFAVDATHEPCAVDNADDQEEDEYLAAPGF